MFLHQKFRDSGRDNNQLNNQQSSQSGIGGNMDENLNQLEQNATISSSSSSQENLNGIIFTSEGLEYDSTLELSNATAAGGQQSIDAGVLNEVSSGQQMKGEGLMKEAPQAELLLQEEQSAEAGMLMSRGEVGPFMLEEEAQSEEAEEQAALENKRLPAGTSKGEEIEPFDLEGGAEMVKETAGGDEPGGENPEGGGDGGAIEGPTLPPIDPNDDPDFQGLEERITEQAELQATHEETSLLSDSAQSSAPLAENETMGGAQALKVEEMNEQEPEAFDAAGFKRMLLDRIDSIMPRNEEEAEDFEDDNELDDLSDIVGDSVVEERERASGPIEETSEEEPDTTEVVEREVSELQTPEPGELLTDLNAEQAMPDPREEMYVEEPVEQRNEQLDDLMAQNEITDEQLANSNEPQFMEALNAKEEAQGQGTQMSSEMRANEQNEIQGAEGEAASVNEQGVTEMFADRENFLMQVVQDQEQGSSDNSAERTRIAGEIHSIYENTRTDVESILNNLDTQVMTMFETASKRAKNNFENFVDARMEAYLDERYDGIGGAVDWVGDTFTGLPEEVNEFFVEGRNRFIAEMDIAITDIADFIAQELNAAKQRIADGRQKIADYVEALPQDLQSIGEEAATAIQSRFDELDTAVNNKQGELVNSLAQKYADSLNAVDQRIEEMQAENKGLIDVVLDAVDGVIEVINQIKATLTNLVSSALDAITAIIADPIGFLGNLIDGLSQGLNNFATNVSDHLMAGMIGWLTGAMGSMGITIPENLFSLEGVFDLVCQVLGLTWDYVREKAVYAIGEDAVQAIEESFEIFQVLQTEGIMGVWEYIQEQMAGLQEMVIDGIKDFLIVNVIEAGIQWMLGLMSPAGAFVKAAMMIIDIVEFFIERGSQIMALLESVIASLAAIAAGSVDFVAQSVEEALASAVPVLIGFLAALVGLDGVAESVQDVIMSVRRRIDDAINGLIDKAKDWFNGKGNNKRKAESEDDVTDEDRAKHEQYANEIETELKAMSPNEGESFEDFRQRIQARANDLEKQYQPKLTDGIKVDIQLTNSVNEDKEDGDVDVEVKIAPNNTLLITKIEAKDTSGEEDDDQLAVVQFQETVENYVNEYWGSDDYRNLLKNLEAEDFLTIQDRALTDLYGKIETSFNKDIKAIISDPKYSLELRGNNPSRKLLFLLNEAKEECANTTLTYNNGEEVSEINSLKEHILELLKRTHFVPASVYAKHIKGKNEAERKSSSEGDEDSNEDGPGQFLYSLSDGAISGLEHTAIENGEIREFRERVGNPVIGMNQYYFRYDFGEDIGYAGGELVSVISVEITGANNNPEVHSHPRDF